MFRKGRNKNSKNSSYADVAELADAHVWGACDFHRMGSSPIIRTKWRFQVILGIALSFNLFLNSRWFKSNPKGLNLTQKV